MTDAPELKPCPFCGGDEIGVGYSMPPYQASVNCYACDVHLISDESEEAAIAAWNTRPEPSDAEVERVAKEVYSENLRAAEISGGQSNG